MHSRPTRIVIAEDHELVREGIKLLLEAENLQVVGEASDGLEAVQVTEAVKPDILLLDMRIPRLHGLEVLRQVRELKGTRVLVLSMHSDEPYVVQALRNGAAGYVLKDCKAAVLIEAIRVVASGGEFLCEPLAQKTLAATLKRLVPGSKSAGPTLTKRELVVLEHAAAGRTNSEIASILFISRRTAEAHRASLMKKLRLRNQTDLVLYAIRNRIITA